MFGTNERKALSTFLQAQYHAMYKNKQKISRNVFPIFRCVEFECAQAFWSSYKAYKEVGNLFSFVSSLSSMSVTDLEDNKYNNFAVIYTTKIYTL